MLPVAAARSSICSYPFLLVVVALAVSGCGGGGTAPDGNLAVGFVYVGSRDDYGYNQAHAAGAAAVKQMPGVRVMEMERVADTIEVQKAMQGMIADDGAQAGFATSFNF